MRLFLDAQVSAHRVARALRERGHDVRAADEERALDGWEDEDLLALAAREDRIMLTFDVKDLARIVREWAEAGREHAGCAILVGIDHSEFGLIVPVVEATLAQRPGQASWRNHSCFVARAASVR